MGFSRREFVFGSGFFLLGCSALPKANDLLSAQTDSAPPSPSTLVFGEKGALHTIRLEDKKIQTCPLVEGFTSHSFIYDSDRDGIWTVEKFGPEALFVDLKRNVMSKRLKAPEGCEFYGHGAITPDKRELWLASFDYRDGRGFYTRVDLARGETSVVGPKITPGIVHDCLFWDDRTFVLTSGGIRSPLFKKSMDFKVVAKSSLILVDWPSGKTSREIFLDRPNEMISHLSVDPLTKKLILLTSSNDRNGPGKGHIYFLSPGDSSLRKLELPETLESRLGIEMLSVAVNPTNGIACVTHPRPGLLLTVDVRNERLIADHEIPSLGAVYDPQKTRFFFNSGALKGQLVSLDQNGQNKESVGFDSKPDFYSNSSHGLLIQRDGDVV